jgi:chromosome segregation ATPase
MPRGRRRATTTPATGTNVTALEEELNKLRQRQTELRQQIRRAKNSQSEIGKLEEKLSNQLATAKWTAEQIKGLRSDWNEIDFYQSVTPRQPAPRGRRRRTVPEEG